MAKHAGVPINAVENIRAVSEVERAAARDVQWSDRISDLVSRFVGSMRFVVAQLTLVVVWAGWNAMAPRPYRFDPYPWSLLTFFVSLEGVLIVTFVLMAQNRMSGQSDERDHLNLQIDLLAEQEMTVVLRLLRQIAEHLQIPADQEDVKEAERLTKPTNIKKLVEALRRREV